MKKNSMNKQLITAIVAGLMVLAFTGSGVAADTIKIGIAGAHSGDLASYGLPIVKAAKLVVEDVNAKGGILGKQIEIIAEDDECKPEKATNTATKLVSDGVVAVVGHVCSGATKAALDIYKDARIIAISASTTNPELTQSGKYPNFFRTIASDDAQARLEVDFVLDTLKLKKIAVLHDKGDYGKGLAEFAKTFIEKSGKGQVVLFEGVTPGAVDYSSVVNKVKKAGAEAIIFGGYHPEASKIVSEMRKSKMKTAFISDDGVKVETFIKVAGKNAEGVYVTGPRDTSSNPMDKTVKEAYKKAYGEDVGAFSINGYAAAQALLNAIQKAGSTDYDAIVKALRTDYVDTPLGKIKFDDRGDAIGVGFSIYQVKDGKFDELKK